MKPLWTSLERMVLEDTSTTGSKFSALDGLRGIAVLTVFFSHSSGFGQRLSPWTNFHAMGQLGVYLFFVLSGFLLAHALLQRPEINFPGFWLRRLFRIAPLYYTVIATVFACQLVQRKAYNDSGIRNLFIAGGWAGFLKHLVFLKGNSVFWTIAAEFEFYFLLPFLVLILLRYGGPAALAMIIVSVAYCGWAIAIHAGYIDPKYALKLAQISHPTQFLDVFLFGIVAAWLWRRTNFQLWWDARQDLLQIAATLFGFALLFGSLACIADQFFFFKHAWVGLRDWSVLFAFGFALMILATLKGNVLFGRVFGHPLLRIVGVTGFSWYLIHFPVLSFMSRAYGPDKGEEWDFVEVERWVTSFVITAVLSTASYLLVEKPFMLYSRSFLRKPAPAAVETVPV